jgi:phosphoribosyl 1,2-cyclic phosphodiesterase
MSRRSDRPASETGDALSITVWGARGSASVSGPDVLEFGGSTLCFEIAAGGRRLIVDAGTGLQRLGASLAETPAVRVDILLTHLHIDHVIGLMAFAPLFNSDASVTVHAPILEDRDPAEALLRLICEPYFPMSPGEAGADFAIRGFAPGAGLHVAGFAIGTVALNHPGGACGYRIAAPAGSVAIITDHEHRGAAAEPALADFCRGVDLLLYDAAFDEAEDYAKHRGWGHSTWQAGLRLREAAGAARLGCIHHAPAATDATLRAREAALKDVHAAGFFAREGERLAVGGQLGRILRRR